MPLAKVKHVIRLSRSDNYSRVNWGYTLIQQLFLANDFEPYEARPNETTISMG